MDFVYTGKCEEFYLFSGFYTFEVWGAQGGNCSYEESGRGGYAKGEIYIENSRQTLYVCVGGKGKYTGNEGVEGGFNGGGKSKAGLHLDKHCAGSGGGATDIRTSLSASDRIIVAGGGGGFASYGNDKSFGGYGGGLEGGTNNTEEQEYGRGATQTEVGKGGIYTSDSWDECRGTDGTKDGKGGDGDVTVAAGAGGGGGGYYGGGGGADIGSGGGGSGYISNLFYKQLLLAGNTSFLSPSGNIEIGHGGDGYARITPIKFNSGSHNLKHFLFPFIINLIIIKIK